MKHLLTIKELTQSQLLALLDLAKKIKANPADYRHALAGKSVVMLFEKPSLRTRVSSISVSISWVVTVFIWINKWCFGQARICCRFRR